MIELVDMDIKQRMTIFFMFQNIKRRTELWKLRSTKIFLQNQIQIEILELKTIMFKR